MPWAWRPHVPHPRSTWSQWLTGGRVRKPNPVATRWDQICAAVCAPEHPLGSCWNWSPTRTSSWFSFPFPYASPFTPSPFQALPQYIIGASTLVSNSACRNSEVRVLIRNQNYPNIPVAQCMIHLKLYLKKEGWERDFSIVETIQNYEALFLCLHPNFSTFGNIVVPSGLKCLWFCTLFCT